MSSSSPLQCLFCNHLNPGGASFCNDCGSQLQLQQCDLCGSINKRSARICYKCGAVFALSLVPGQHFSLPEGREIGGLNALGGEPTTLPESAAQALHDYRGESAQSSLDGNLERTSETEGHLPELTHYDSACGEGAACAPVAASKGGQYRRLALRTGLLVSVAAVAGYFYLGLSKSGSVVPEPARVSISSGNGAGRLRPSGEGALVNEPAVRGASFRILGFNAELSPGAPVSAAPAASTSSVAGRAEATEARPLVPACEAPVAALGLCDSVKKWEKR